MASLPRIVLPGIPHHVSQRGYWGDRTFVEDGDYALHLDPLADAAARLGVEIWSYCLMPNHVHVVAVPRDENSLSRIFRHVYRHCTWFINARLRVTDHLWHGRFSSVAMDEAHTVSAFRYVALNAVRAKLVAQAADWRWSSTTAHFARKDDHVVTVAPALNRVGDFEAILGAEFDEALCYASIRKVEAVGRPVGSRERLLEMETRTGRTLLPAKRGPKSKALAAASSSS